MQLVIQKIRTRNTFVATAVQTAFYRFSCEVPCLERAVKKFCFH